MLAELGNQGLAQSRGPHLTYLKKPQTLELIGQVMQNLNLEVLLKLLICWLMMKFVII
jgi:hypothetical protein